MYLLYFPLSIRVYSVAQYNEIDGLVQHYNISIALAVIDTVVPDPWFDMYIMPGLLTSEFSHRQAHLGVHLCSIPIDLCCIIVSV